MNVVNDVIATVNATVNDLSMVKNEDDMNKVDATIDSLNKKMDKLREEEMYLYR